MQQLQQRSTDGTLTEQNETKAAWLLEVLYEDLKDWQEWLWTSRRLPPLLLGGMGSDPCTIPLPLTAETHPSGSQEQQLWCKKSWGMGQLQGARFESLDNSPMYDDPGGGYVWWNASTYRMNLYDVGQVGTICGVERSTSTVTPRHVLTLLIVYCCICLSVLLVELCDCSGV